MTKFEDGPAQGVTLCLKRTPQFLRVTHGSTWDALDQPEDSPLPTESILAYRLHEHLGNCHINRGRKGSGFYPIATYRLVPQQPSDAQMRDRLAWSQWCNEQPPPF